MKYEIDVDAFNRAAKVVYNNAIDHGLMLEDPDENQAKEEMAWLMDEAAEAMTAFLDDGPSEKIPFTRLAEELADVILVAMSLAHGYGIDIGRALEAKHAYNLARSYKHR